MFTPNELREISFDKARFGGYDVSSVDKKFASICEDYATLFKENAVLKKKLKLLADTVEEYRSVDDDMRKALITAKNMASEMVADAEKKSKEMLTNASEQAKLRAAELGSLVEAEEKRLLDARNATSEFIDNITAMFTAESEKFLALKDAVTPETPTQVEDTADDEAQLGDTIDQIAKSLEEKMMLEDAAIAGTSEQIENTDAEDPDAEESDISSNDEDSDMKKVEDNTSIENEIPTEKEMAELEAAAEKKTRRRRVEFENLKFGTDYDIKSED